MERRERIEGVTWVVSGEVGCVSGWQGWDSVALFTETFLLPSAWLGHGSRGSRGSQGEEAPARGRKHWPCQGVC